MYRVREAERKESKKVEEYKRAEKYVSKGAGEHKSRREVEQGSKEGGEHKSRREVKQGSREEVEYRSRVAE